MIHLIDLFNFKLNFVLLHNHYSKEFQTNKNTKHYLFYIRPKLFFVNFEEKFYDNLKVSKSKKSTEEKDLKLWLGASIDIVSH